MLRAQIRIIIAETIGWQWAAAIAFKIASIFGGQGVAVIFQMVEHIEGARFAFFHQAKTCFLAAGQHLQVRVPHEVCPTDLRVPGNRARKLRAHAMPIG